MMQDFKTVSDHFGTLLFIIVFKVTFTYTSINVNQSKGIAEGSK